VIASEPDPRAACSAGSADLRTHAAAPFRPPKSGYVPRRTLAQGRTKERNGRQDRASEQPYRSASCLAWRCGAALHAPGPISSEKGPDYVQAAIWRLDSRLHLDRVRAESRGGAKWVRWTLERPDKYRSRCLRALNPRWRAHSRWIHQGRRGRRQSRRPRVAKWERASGHLRRWSDGWLLGSVNQHAGRWRVARSGQPRILRGHLAGGTARMNRE